eukprot:TRINITY_DN4875_c0_g1_i1.p1 TRINITY_DN4875_c0_g1~~TRINITY_DN4875_c0_g1_i1.p1  ORF type:complete len:244 (+),score=85.96 TRINITY_DN4875_c0_g1_i1:44-733(+)
MPIPPFTNEEIEAHVSKALASYDNDNYSDSEGSDEWDSDEDSNEDEEHSSAGSDSEEQDSDEEYTESRTAKPTPAPAPAPVSTPSTSSNTPSTTAKRPKPPNAFILFSLNRRPQLLAANPSLSNAEVSRLLGTEWRSLHPEEKLRYKSDSKVEAAKYGADAQYKFVPPSLEGAAPKRKRAARPAAPARASVSVAPAPASYSARDVNLLKKFKQTNDALNSLSSTKPTSR